MFTPFSITDSHLAQLASGPADAQTLDFLRQGQLSKHLQLAAHIIRELPDESPAVALLSQVQARAPEIANELLTAPCFGSWAARAARRLLGQVETALPLHVEVSYLGATAAVAAIRAKIDADLTLYVRDGYVLLPTLGAARLDLADLSPVQANVEQGRLTLTAGGLPEDLRQETGTWLPVRTVSAEASGQTISLAVEDLDYYRDCYGKTLAGRMSDQDFATLAALLQPAWELLVEHVPDRAKELAVGLRSLVQLSVVDAGPGLSATSATAYGALGLTLPEQPEHLAATLVHEFQHSKLSALLDLLPLFDKATTDRDFAPWKDEPRPIGGLLQGAFAFLAVADYWRRLFEAGIGSKSEKYFAEWRVQVDDVLTTLQSGQYLNQDGKTFVSHMRVALADLLAVTVAADVDAAARRHLKETYKAWLQRNAGAFLAHQAVPVGDDNGLGALQGH